MTERGGEGSAMFLRKPSNGKSPTGETRAWWRSPWLWGLLALYALALFLDGRQEPAYCDEGSFLRNVGHFAMFRTAEPVFTNYPTFYSYFLAGPIYLVYCIYYVFVRRFPLEGLFDWQLFAVVFRGDTDIWLWVGRSISILCAAGTLALVYRYCVTRLSRPALMLALGFLVSSPYYFYMQYARYALPDVPIAFLVTLILFMAVRYLDRPQDKSLYLASFLAGLAASAKLNGLLALAPLLALPWMVPAPVSSKLRRLVFIMACAALGFCAGSPFNVFKPGIYASGFSLEAELLVSSTVNIFPQWMLAALWSEDFAMTLLSLAAIAVSFARNSRPDRVFHVILIFSVLCLGALAKRSPHYLIPLFPWLCVVIGEMAEGILKMGRLKILRSVLIGLLAGVLAFECGKLAVRVMQNSRPDNRTLSMAWIRQNISADEHILLDVDYVPRIGFINLKILKSDEYISRNRYPKIVRQYVSKNLYDYFSVKYIWTFDIPVRELKEQGWRYFVTADSCFDPFLNAPDMPDWVENGGKADFKEYLNRRIFYLRLFRESLDIKVIKEGSGPKVYIFRLQ